MRKKKETHEEVIYSHVSKVDTHRKDKNQLKIKGVLMIEPPINLTLGISKEDLQRLFHYAVNSGNDLSGELSVLLADAIHQTKKRARGTHKGREITVSHIKREAGLLYLLFTEAESEPVKYPFFKKLLDTLDDDHKEFDKNSGQPFPVMLTAYCLEKYYGERLKNIGLNLFHTDSFDSFFHTYINPSLMQCKKSFLSMRSPGQRDIFKQEPFYSIFKDMD